MNEIVAFQEKIKSLSIRDKAFLLESEMLKMPQLELKLNHYFSDGVYARELLIPKDTIIVGKLHKFQNLNILVKGDILVSVDNGEVKRLRPPAVIVSPAGTKRFAYTLEDTIWTTILRTEELDVDKIEEHFTAKTEQEFLDFCREQEQFKLFDLKA